jgi:alanyl-tRNA synthetase
VSARLDGALGSPAGIKAVAQAIASRGRIALVAGVEGERAHLCFARARGPGVHLGEILRESAALLGGKGGGAPELAQGSGPDGARLDEALAAAVVRAGGG